MKSLISLFKNKRKSAKTIESKVDTNSKQNNEEVALRKGVIGEYKIDIQLAQLPKSYLYISDLFIKNDKSSTGFSQIDHVILTPYGIFIIETKNYQGTIYGNSKRKEWLINGKFKMINPLVQNYGHIQAIKPYINSTKEGLISIISFTKRSTVKVEPELRKISSNELVIYDVELMDFINRKVNVNKLINKQPIFSDEEIKNTFHLLSKANILDLALRETHNNSIQKAKIDTNQVEKEKSTCYVCKKTVSDKVISFCLSNKKFGGKIYCYDHQKDLNK